MWYSILFVTCNVVLAAVLSSNPVTTTFEDALQVTENTNFVQDTTLLSELDSIWGDNKVEQDFEKACNYHVPHDKRAAQDSAFSSVWLNRKILFHTLDSQRTGIRTPGTFAPLSLQWDVSNRFIHEPADAHGRKPQGTSKIEGGCSFGAGVDAMTKAQLTKAGALYSIEQPKNYLAEEQYRGQVTTASADMAEWFAWHTLKGKFAARVTYGEKMHYEGSPVGDLAGRERQVSDLECVLFYKPKEAGSQATRIEKTFWSLTLQKVREHGRTQGLSSITC